MKNAVIFNDSGHDLTRRTMGAYKVADMMRKLGWTVEVIDWIEHWSDNEVQQFVDQLPYKITLFAFGNLWMTDTTVVNKISFLKKTYPGTKFLLGGPKPYQMDFGADCMVFGYSEKVLQPVLEWMFDGGEQPKGKYPEWAPNSLLVDANHMYAGLDIDKFNCEYHSHDFIESHEALTLETSRGCRFKCKYCNYAFLGVKEDYSRSEEDLYQELMNNYEKWGTTNYIISDDTFNDRDSKIEKLALAVERLPFEPNFTCFIRLDLVISKPHQVDLLIRARCWGHFYGIETFHPEAAKAIGKGMHPDRIKKGLLWIRDEFNNRLGLYRGTCGMIAGLPYEPVQSWYDSLDWLDKNWESFFYWGLHISDDPDTQTQSDFSVDAQKFGYFETKNQEILDWSIEKGYNVPFKADPMGRLNNKLDNRALIWENDITNFKEASLFGEMYHKEYFFKQKLSNFDMTEYIGKFPADKKELLSLTLDEMYFKRKYASVNKQRIEKYKQKKLSLFK